VLARKKVPDVLAVNSARMFSANEGAAPRVRGRPVPIIIQTIPFTTNVFRGMEASKLAKAEKLAQSWKPNPAKCARGSMALSR